MVGNPTMVAMSAGPNGPTPSQIHLPDGTTIYPAYSGNDIGMFMVPVQHVTAMMNIGLQVFASYPGNGKINPRPGQGG